VASLVDVRRDASMFTVNYFTVKTNFGMKDSLLNCDNWPEVTLSVDTK